jgi:uncharacterized protein (DUF1501 family)
MSLTRRAFLKSGSLAVFSIGVGGIPTFLPRAAWASTRPGRPKPVLVTLFQRGAMDGLMAVQPLNDPHLALARPNLLLPTSGEGALLDLDGRFGMHPSFTSMHQLFKRNEVAVIHGVGSPDPTRSHFDAQDYMETGTPGRKGTSSGWLNRAVGLMGHEATPFSSVSLTASLPRSLYGEEPSLAVGNLDEFQVHAGQQGNQSLENLYKDLAQDPKQKKSDVSKLLSKRGEDAFEATRLISSDEFRNYKPANGARYPTSGLGRSLRQISQLIKAGVGLEIAFAEVGGWDTHVAQGNSKGTFSRNILDLSDSIAAFWQDLGDKYQGQVVLMTMTEFGRTVHQNGSNGTDHGRGSCMFVLGHDVKGGHVYGNVPELATENLEDHRDLPVTTDFRSLFSDVACKHLGIPEGQKTALFPGWNGQPLALMT